MELEIDFGISPNRRSVLAKSHGMNHHISIVRACQSDLTSEAVSKVTAP